jgi:hypothetical protein
MELPMVHTLILSIYRSKTCRQMNLLVIPHKTIFKPNPVIKRLEENVSKEAEDDSRSAQSTNFLIAIFLKNFST